MNSKLTDSGLISVSGTYPHYTDNVLLQRSFDAIESGIIMELRKELANMTLQRDKWVQSSVTDHLNADRYVFLRDKCCLTDEAVDMTMNGCK